MQNYEKLECWRRAHRLALVVFRAAERIGDWSLRSQLRRAMSSVPANIVEGASCATAPEFRRFLGIAIASLNEADYHLLFCADLGVLPTELVVDTRAELRQLRRMLHSLRRAVIDGIEAEKKGSPPPKRTDDPHQL